MGIFEANEIETGDRFLIDNRLNPSDLIFVVYSLGNRLKKISLTQTSPSAKCLGSLFGVVNNKLHIDGWSTELGYQEIKGTRFLILSRDNARTYFFIFNTYKKLVISSDEFAGIKSPGKTRLILDQDRLIVDIKEADVYYNDQKIVGHHVFSILEGASFLTPHYLLEKRPSQWKITVFSDDFTFEPNHVLGQKRKSEFPKDFPDYRRSPRLNLEVPTDKFKLQGSSKHQEKKGHSLLKMIMPPLMMIGMTGVTTLLSGRDALMMLGMGGASLLTTTFTVSQFFTEKKANKLSAIKEKENDLHYLVTAVGEITRRYKREKEVLAFQLPSPEKLVDMTAVYQSRIYERQVHNKDFLTVSLGTCDTPSSLTIETDVNDKDLSHEAKHLKTLAKQFSTQRQVPTAISLLDQTLGLIGAQDVLTTSLENLLFQTAFFHSYRDVNFISLLSRKAYQETWQNWRLLPHFKLQELNMRGLIYNEKLRDIVLNAFYQHLIKRKQVLKEAGREKVQFSPHYILTIVDDALLSGHGINELLAEDMSELGVTVIWCKEDANQLPETVVSLVEIPNTTNGQLISDHTVYLAKPFVPYPALPDLAVSLINQANLNHLEVEKNAVPESLSLLEQYEVKTVEALEIGQRWETAEPNKSIKSLIGWRGKSDYVYWDLHERGHGPHALVGGTTGSGKSEFLTTYLIGLAINFSPEDIGMLIIDWKGGGIANTLDKLPHFMGAITNLDGAGTARALASIKAELDKRQREFARYGVNSINDYMSLYKQRHESKPDVNYPTKPLPHLILVSDEFAELKANVPEFLDELTSVARIGRSLGVHLILATQKPSGVVNDQIEANSRSKIALKMAGVQDSNELLKTPDAAHITNPGRGYLRVGENEVYDLFQSGYAGVPYDPEAENEAKVDERIFSINALGQYELMYDPTEEVVQGKDTSDLPSQLDAVIDAIGSCFKARAYLMPDRPWLANLSEKIVTPIAQITQNSQSPMLTIPLGFLDIPTKQAQEVYLFDLVKQGHTVIFASPGYGKSTVLQTLVMNLARQNTPEKVQFNLLDFGTNGLLPLKDLPHVADIVTLEETEKLQKMLAKLASELATRKKLFKEIGVASLAQYETKTTHTLPVILTILDSYDSLDQNDPRKDKIDTCLIQLLRDGAGLGVYLILTAGRVGAVRPNMMSNISTKLLLYLNDENDVATIMGRDKLGQTDLFGRGQVMRELPTVIQFYLPVAGKNGSDLLANLEQAVAQLDHNWTGPRPAKIPMVPAELTIEGFDRLSQVIQWQNEQKLPLGMSYETTDSLGFIPGRQPYFLFAPMDDDQNSLFQQLLLRQISKVQTEVLLIDFNESFEETIDQTTLSQNVTVITDKNEAREIIKGMVGYGQLLKRHEVGESVILVISNIQDFIKKTAISASDFMVLLKNTYKAGLDIIIFSPHEYISKSYDDVPKAIRQLKFSGLIGSRIYDSALIKGSGLSSEPELDNQACYFVLRGGSAYDKIKLPKLEEGLDDV
ncbi:type VII secretion protein EssC [Lactococcus piscium]|uniref:type VII secretion protein EssC n=1 Tax=Pseudolactococcus carnosus TaxID=2749961 RepID=UPI001FBA4626|nr:type VII secretion protein EssC [Lactococcus carnosus]MCJ1996485.1 type VII secretion protein EssC [Lactococcus carnosus]